MDDLNDDTFSVAGDPFMTTYQEERQRGIAAMEQGRLIIDFQKLEELDSSAVAFMLECVRVSNNQAKFRSVPKALSGLVDLYGVTCLFDTTQG